jgi:ubiquitin fusion degradation protein 1
VWVQKRMALSAAAGCTLPRAGGAAADGKAGSAVPSKGASPSPPEPEEPQFLAFAGTARRLDGKAAGPSVPVPVPLRPGGAPGAGAAGSAGAGPSGSPAAAGSAGAGPSGSAGGQRAGTFVNFGPTGNRLEAKLAVSGFTP